MPTFVIERDIPPGKRPNDQELEELSRRSLQRIRDLAPEVKIEWLHSYVTDDKVYCIYVAPDPDWIRRHAALAEILPASRVSEVRRLLNQSEGRKV